MAILVNLQIIILIDAKELKELYKICIFAHETLSSYDRKNEYGKPVA